MSMAICFHTQTHTRTLDILKYALYIVWGVISLPCPKYTNVMHQGRKPVAPFITIYTYMNIFRYIIIIVRPL